LHEFTKNALKISIIKHDRDAAHMRVSPGEACKWRRRSLWQSVRWRRTVGERNARIRSPKEIAAPITR
jgi:hypothetical protein